MSPLPTTESHCLSARFGSSPVQPRRCRRLLATLAAFMLVGLAGVLDAARAGTIYVYERGDGSRLITDHKRLEPGYRLVKTYSDERTTYQPLTRGRRQRSPGFRAQKTHYDQLIINAAGTHDLDPSLIKAVIQVESGFDRHAVSHKGASGLMQLMPATAKRFGVASVFDPQENVSAGARYLRHLLTLFNGDTRLALAGYNAGEHAVKRHGGVPPYAETRAYVKRVMELHRRYLTLDCDQGGVRNCAPRGGGSG